MRQPCYIIEETVYSFHAAAFFAADEAAVDAGLGDQLLVTALLDDLPWSMTRI